MRRRKRISAPFPEASPAGTSMVGGGQPPRANVAASGGGRWRKSDLASPPEWGEGGGAAVDGLAAVLAMVLLRYARGWDQSALARETRTSPAQVSAYHGGKAVPPLDFLERAAKAADLPAHLFEPMLRAVRSFVAASGGRSRADRVLPQGMAYELIGLLSEAVDLIREPLDGRESAPPDPEDVEALWELLRRRSSAERRLLVEEGVEYQSRALSERVAAESRELAEGRPAEARELGELAVRMAELAIKTGPTGRRSTRELSPPGLPQNKTGRRCRRPVRFSPSS